MDGGVGTQASPLTQDEARDLCPSCSSALGALGAPIMPGHWAGSLEADTRPCSLVSASLLRTWAFSGALDLCTRSPQGMRV